MLDVALVPHTCLNRLLAHAGSMLALCDAGLAWPGVPAATPPHPHKHTRGGEIQCCGMRKAPGIRDLAAPVPALHSALHPPDL
jgi:hypothetical protein